MTLIVYANGVLAADTSLWDGVVYAADIPDKIMVCANGVIAGGAGRLQDLRRFQEWAGGGEKPTDFSKTSIGVIYSRKGLAEYHRDLEPTWLPVDGAYAWGTGCEFAHGCLAAGLTAEDTVRLAIEKVAYVGGDVAVFTLDDLPDDIPAEARPLGETAEDWKQRRGLAAV